MTWFTSLITINNVNINTIYKSFPQNVIKVLSRTYLNKTKVQEKTFNFHVQLAKVSCINCAQAICTWFLNWLRFYGKMDFPIRMRIIYITRHRHMICLKFGDTFLNSLVGSICSTIKENLFLHCRKFPAFIIDVIFQDILTTRSWLQRN